MWYDNPQREGSVSTPMGKERFCPLENEIPVGQTVDNSKKWVVDINSDIEKFEEVVQAVLDKMEKVGKMKDDPIVKDYCSCSARMITGERICASDCQFIQRQICPPGKACYWDCYCSVIPCKGPPCLQLLDYMTELWNACRDFELYYADINKKIIKNPSGDLLKQLTYSREKMSDCSLQNTIQGAISRVLSCERIKHEIIPPISGRNILFNENSYSAGCYGKGLNEFTPTSEVPTENWFCCEELTKDPRTSPNPIYNIRK